MRGRSERRKVPRFCQGRECSLETCGGLLPRGVSIHYRSWSFLVLTEAIEPKIYQPIMERKYLPRRGEKMQGKCFPYKESVPKFRSQRLIHPRVRPWH